MIYFPNILMNDWWTKIRQSETILPLNETLDDMRNNRELMLRLNHQGVYCHYNTLRWVLCESENTYEWLNWNKTVLSTLDWIFKEIICNIDKDTPMSIEIKVKIANSQLEKQNLANFPIYSCNLIRNIKELRWKLLDELLPF